MAQSFKKWIQLGFLGCGLLAWVLLRELLPLVFSALGLIRLDWVVPPVDIAGLAIGFGVFLVLLRWEKANLFLEEAFAELVKVTWPKRKETLLSTGVVAVMVGIATLAVLFFDSLWAWVAETLLY